MKITKVNAREVFDSRGNPTVEAEVFLEDGSNGRAIVPSGASTGEHEAIEIRDGDKDRFNGKGVLKAVENIRTKILDVIKGTDAEDQFSLDAKMIEADGSKNKSNFGANAILAVSMASACAQANSEGKKLFEYLSKYSMGREVKLPVPMMNVINGGKHAPEGVDMQEFMVMPHGAESFSDAMRIGIETFHALREILHDRGMVTLVGDEGGFAPGLKKNSEAIEIILEAIEKAGYTPGQDASIAMDPAVSEFFKDGIYDLAKEGIKFDRDGMIGYWKDLVEKYPIVSLEDILDQNDWEGWSMITKELGERVQIVGDDFLVTNPERLTKAIETKAGNAILVKVNQIGTVKESIESINISLENSWNAIVSHRSGETEDTFISDLVVGLGTGQIKTGSLSRTDRIAKYNQLLRIEEYLGDKAIFVNPFK
ncbi:MAG TPA: phosphopyruvate hydratase [Candidatus Dojkabacteria bacterium]|jgi:enolase